MTEKLPVYHTTKGLTNRIKVLNDIPRERSRQDDKWGKQHHDHGTWLKILIEEVGEVAQAMQADKGWGKATDKDDLYNELKQVAAVAMAMMEQVLDDEN